MGYINGIAILACINMVAVCGVIILTGYTGLFSLGHAGLVAIGAYSAGILAKYYHVHFVPAILLGRFSPCGQPDCRLSHLRGRLKGDYLHCHDGVCGRCAPAAGISILMGGPQADRFPSPPCL